ncbi:phage holin [Schleiferilactobacillus perolens]|uniref:phage holin n=1 Tax=Schleiferilactobacillus perolens TaxID=100468 RepID=UPI0039E8290A
MTKINWLVRIKNKTFWLALVPALLLLVQVIAVPFGYKFDITGINKDFLDIINATFALLAVLGVVQDPTTPGATDSTQALSYDKPGADKTQAATTDTKEDSAK